MGRQLFLHHYLPAHLASALVTGALLEFIFNLDPDGLDSNVIAENTGQAPRKRRGTETDRTGKRVVVPQRRKAGTMLGLWAASGVVLSLIIFGWYWFLPLTYGRPGLSVAEVNQRKWLSYDLHFAK